MGMGITKSKKIKGCSLSSKRNEKVCAWCANQNVGRVRDEITGHNNVSISSIQGLRGKDKRQELYFSGKSPSSLLLVATQRYLPPFPCQRKEEPFARFGRCITHHFNFFQTPSRPRINSANLIPFSFSFLSLHSHLFLFFLPSSPLTHFTLYLYS
jgi:hypothetical protein